MTTDQGKNTRNISIKSRAIKTFWLGTLVPPVAIGSRKYLEKRSKVTISAIKNNAFCQRYSCTNKMYSLQLSYYYNLPPLVMSFIVSMRLCQ